MATTEYQPTNEEIAVRAFELYNRRTSNPRSDVDVYLNQGPPEEAATVDWLDAESELKTEHADSSVVNDAEELPKFHPFQ